MNNEIRHVTWGFGNAWISLSTFSPIGLKETHPQTSNEVMSFEQKKIKNDCQIFIRPKKTQIMVKYENCVLKEDIK